MTSAASVRVRWLPEVIEQAATFLKNTIKSDAQLKGTLHAVFPSDAARKIGLVTFILRITATL
jgi:hypothetical protein